MSRNFTNIAKILKTNRIKVGLSQTKLSEKLGFKNGQFVSNVERGLCNLPMKSIKKVSVELEIDQEILIDAMTQDFKEHLIELN